MATYAIEDLKEIAKELSHKGYRVIYLSANLEPLQKWKDYREIPLTNSEIENYFSDPNTTKPAGLAIALRGKGTRSIAIDIDGKDAQDVFFNEFMPLLPNDIQDEINKSPRTATKSGGLHIRLVLAPNFTTTTTIRQDTKWSDITIVGAGDNTKHSQINVLGTEHMLREFGPGYSTIIGHDSKVVFTIGEIRQILNQLTIFKHATQMLKIAGDVLRPFWKSPDRDAVVFATSGFLAKNGGVPEALTIRLFNHIMRVTALDDENKMHTLSVIEDTYNKISNNEIVSGYDRFKSVVKTDSIVDEIQSAFHQLGYFAEYHNGNTTESSSTTIHQDTLFWIPAEAKKELEPHVWGITCYYPKTIIIAHQNLNKMVEATIASKDSENKNTGQKITSGSIVIRAVHLNAIPLEVTKHQDPLRMSLLDHKYTIKFKTSTGHIFNTHEPSSLESIMTDLGNRALVASEFGAKNALVNIINEFENRGIIHVNGEIQTPGFFLVSGKLKAYRMDFREHSMDELKETCYFLNDLVSRHYRKNIPATSIKWGMIAPFNFALKQYTNDLCWIPWLAICGFPRSGKGTQGRIAAGLWTEYGSNKYYIPFTSVNTEARLAKKLSMDTLIRIINECNDLNNEKQSHLLEMFKTSIESRISRSTYISRTSYVDELALSTGVLTSNQDFPIETGFRSRIIHIIETKEDKYWNEEQRIEFDSFMYKGRKHLRTLGDFTANYILNNPNVLLKDNPEECNWKKTAKIVLEGFYKAAKCEIPDWTSQFVEETDVTAKAIEEAEETNYFELRGFLESDINERFRLDPYRNSEGYVTAATFPEKLDHCLSNRLVPYLHRRDKSEIVITHDIIKELRKARIVNLTTMPALAKEIQDFKYEPTWFNGKTRRVIHGPYNSFITFLNDFSAGDIPQKPCKDVRM